MEATLRSHSEMIVIYNVFTERFFLLYLERSTYLQGKVTSATHSDALVIRCDMDYSHFVITTEDSH